MEPDGSVVGGWRPAGGPGHRVYGVGLGGDPTGLALEFFDAVEAMEIGLEGVLTEFSPGQMEINLAYGPALAAADSAQLVKEMTREVAARRGYRATYLGRPDALSVGSGPARQLLGAAGVRWRERVRRPVAAGGPERAGPPERSADCSGTTRRSPGCRRRCSTATSG